MQDTGKISFGSILIALGVAYILNNSRLVSSFFWTFLGVFLVLFGLSMLVLAISRKTRKNEIENLFLLFMGASITIIQLGIVTYSHFVMFSLALGSIGMASLISGAFLQYSLRNIISGIVMIAVSVIFFLPPLVNLSEKVQNIIRQFGIGVVLILVGIVLFLPSKKGGKNEML